MSIMKKIFRKILAVMIIMTVFAASLTACGAKTYKITIGSDADNITECPKRAKAGETVTVYTVSVTDADLHVSIDGVNVVFVEECVYQFVMPDHDVVIKSWVDTSGYPGA